MTFVNSTKTLSDGTLLGRTSRRLFWCWLLFLIHCCFCDVGCCCFYVSGLLFHATGTPPWLLGPVKASISSELYPGYFRLLHFSVTFLPRVPRFWVGIFYPQEFFTLRSFPTFPASLGARSSSLKVAGPPTEVWNTHPAHLFVWIKQCSAKGISR